MPTKLVIQIPCFNEEATLPVTLADLPREIEGVDVIEVLVIDDGSTDRTADVAKEGGVDHILRIPRNRGLASAFQAGLDGCLRAGADIIVNTDADNQYRGADIPALVAPILEGRAGMVVGDRRTDTIDHFSWGKKRLQKIGSWIVRRLSGTDVPDAASGFRAFTREAALRLNVLSRFSYVLETLIQAGRMGLGVSHVPIRTNPMLRKSRLYKSLPAYLKRSAGTLLRIFLVYEPLRVFWRLFLVCLVVGLVLIGRFLWYYFTTPGDTGKVQSLLLGATSLTIGFHFLVVGVLSDLIASNRKLLEESLYRVRRMELDENETSGGKHDGSPPGEGEPSR
jgi:glycosyltransferase involved in cell wall biosynthesis